MNQKSPPPAPQHKYYPGHGELEAKRAAALKYLGARWVLDPSHKVRRRKPGS